MSIAEKFVSMEYGPAPEDPKEASSWLERHGRRFGLFIDGTWQAPAAGEYFDSFDPSNGEMLASVAQGGTADVDAAVCAARAAAPKWRALTPHARARYLYSLARLVQKHSRLLAVLETMDNGKPIRESRDIDIPLVARHFYHHAGWAQLLDQEFPEYEPCGVVGQIIPWNFPLLMLAWKIAPALATGNTVVLKPAEFTPLTALAFAELCVEAGLPAGVVNIVTGDGSKLDALFAARPQRAIRNCRSNLVESPHLSFSRMPTSIARSRDWSMASGSTRGKYAARDRGCSCRKASRNH
jgi:aldehyde dehydrogenase (NAD+)